MIKKKISDKELALYYLKDFSKSLESEIKGVKSMFDASTLTTVELKLTFENKNLIAIWIMANQINIIQNVFDEKLSSALKHSLVKGTAVILKLDYAEVLNLVDDYIQDFRANYGSIGNMARWLIERLYDKPIRDPYLNIYLDKYIQGVSFKWKDFSKEYRIILE